MKLDKFKKILFMWLTRIGHYFITLVLLAIFVVFILLLIPDIHNLWTNDIYSQYNTTQLNDMGFFDNERYLLSALIQSLAATIALVITLSLVAVQLAAQSYSPRVIDVYKRNPDMWILLCIYIITIFYGLGLTKIIGLGILGNYMEGAIFVAYFMGFFAFVCLVPYMLKTLDLLKPSCLMGILADEITKENVIALADFSSNNKKQNDKIQPIVEVINFALDRNDTETVLNGFMIIQKRTTSILEDSFFEKKEEDKFSKYIIYHIMSIWIRGAEKNTDSTLATIDCLGKIAIKAATKKYAITVLRVSKSLQDIGTKSIELNNGFEVEFLAGALKAIGTKAIEKETRVCSIKETGIRDDFISEKVVENLRLLAQKSINPNLLIAKLEILNSLHMIAIKATEKSFKYTATVAIKGLIESVPAKDESNDIAQSIKESLNELRDKIKGKEWDNLETEISTALNKIKESETK
ncbi:DUF2254 family protein [Methanolobus sp.]|uniref:DUF2254 family protein n=1 Tax=Methanolobus sp. TaxID=1874737 RepID=UPI0025D61C3C|nr:DUF2254 family protein [Methanolobus sp.]